jgi:hypothetical protein
MAIGREIKAMIILDHDVLDIRCPNVHPDAHAKLEFQRTLRIPDDEKVYGLPAGLGCFPIRHVEDFSEKLDELTLRRGGVMMPMHRSEAMWIHFRRGGAISSRYAYPFAIKVAAGKVNALTGGAWSPTLCSEEQDYVVIPGQPWIDGFAVSKGIIRQFVAERLGDGFSAEEQLTGKAEFGGLQIIAYPMKVERYLEVCRAREEEDREAEERARARERELQNRRIRELLAAFSEFSDRAGSLTASSNATLAHIEHSLRSAVEASSAGALLTSDRLEAELRGLLERWGRQVAELAKLSLPDFNSSQAQYSMSSLRETSVVHSPKPAPMRSMGLGAGGRMRQEIYTDPYGVDAWDQSAGSRCFVHLVDAGQWADISGSPAPTTPPTQQEYQAKGLPWFDYYAPEKEAIAGSKLLAGLTTWGSMYGEDSGAFEGKSGPAIQLGTAPRFPGMVSEGTGDE